MAIEFDITADKAVLKSLAEVTGAHFWENGEKAGRRAVYHEVLQEVQSRIRLAPPYTDTRALTDLQTMLEDKLRLIDGSG